MDALYMTAVTTHMPMPLRFNTLKAAAEIRIENPDHLDELDTILDDVETAMNKRNAVAHGSWVTDPRTGKTYTQKTTARGSIDTEFSEMNVETIKKDALAIIKSGYDLLTFLKAKNLLPPVPSQRIDRSQRTKEARKKRKQK